MTEPRSDALVLFGATGDLAFKQIFPALYAMARRGRLDFPVIGIARPAWTDDQLRALNEDWVHGLSNRPFADDSLNRKYQRIAASS